MKRKQFLKNAARACLACAGAAVLSAQETKPAAGQAANEQKAREMEKRFKEEYLRTLMENMEKQLDEKTRTKLMTECGRACARRGPLYKQAQKYKGDVKSFVQDMAPLLGEKNAVMDGNTVRWGYRGCYCELVAEGPDRLPASYCLCSVGWVLEMFETVAQKPVKVELVQSIKQGASSCKFLVRL